MTHPTPISILLVGDPSPGWGRLRSALFAGGAGAQPGSFTESPTLADASRHLLGSEFSAIVFAFGPTEPAGLRAVRWLAAFRLPLLVWAARYDASLAEQASALGAGDWLTADEAETPAIVQRALRCAVDRQRVAEHQRREQRLQQQLQSANGQEILMREAGHTIGNLLTPGQLLAYRGQETVPEPGRSLFMEIEQSIGDASGSLARMHNLRRSGDGAMSVPRLVALDEALRSSLKPLRRLLPANIELVVDTGNAAGEQVLLDENEFPQIVLGLALNAIHAMRGSAGGMLRLSLSAVAPSGSGRPGYLELAIADTGRGIDPRHRDRIFEPFFTTRASDGGIGLGLPGCRSFMERHGGKIAVESVPGQGSCFRLRFPESGTLLANRPQGDFSFGAGNLTLLLVEPEERWLLLTSYCLGQIGVTVLAVPDAQSARRQFFAHQDRIDIVQIDPGLPDEHGLVLWHDFKAQKPSLQLILSPSDPALLKDSALPEADMQHILHKPYALQDLAGLIERILA